MTVFVAAQNSGGLTDALLIGLFLCIAFPPVVSTVLQTVPLSLTSSISMKQSQFRLILNIFISFFFLLLDQTGAIFCTRQST